MSSIASLSGGVQHAAQAAAAGSMAEGVAVEFLAGDAARTAIVDDDDMPYFSRLGSREIAAKTGLSLTGAPLAEQRDACRRRFQDGIRAFSEAEKTALRWFAEQWSARSRALDARLADTPWSFLKLSDELEGGFPHTRGRHIVLPESLGAGLAKAWRRFQDSGNQGVLLTAIALMHEQVHVFQRAHPDLFDSLYADLWDFEKAQEIRGCQRLEPDRLSNPDTGNSVWVRAIRRGDSVRYVWPRLMLAAGELPALAPENIRLLGIELRKVGPRAFECLVDESAVPRSVDLLSLREYRKPFSLVVRNFFALDDESLSSTSPLYHPDEIAAELITKIIVFDTLSPKDLLSDSHRRTLEQRLSPLREWLRMH